MNYHDITHEDMKNGDGLRVVLWVSGCTHYCVGCQNPLTWNPADGLPFTDRERAEIFSELEKDYVSGITFSGGDPLHPENREEVRALMRAIRRRFPAKTLWLYTGYTWREISDDAEMSSMMPYVDVLVEGPFKLEHRDVTFPWAGSTNQRVIDVKQTLREGGVVLHESH